MMANGLMKRLNNDIKQLFDIFLNVLFFNSSFIKSFHFEEQCSPLYCFKRLIGVLQKTRKYGRTRIIRG